MDEKNGRRLLDANTTASTIETSRSHFDALVAAGLPCYDITLPGRKRRRLRFDLEQVLAWVAARRAA